MYLDTTIMSEKIGEIKKAPLQYEYTALAPTISELTMKLHFDRHYAGYVKTLNALIEDTRFAEMSLENIVMQAGEGAIFNNAAQVWNHEFYFTQLSSDPQRSPSGYFLEAINRSFGSFEEFKTRALVSATSLFGSGWVWLVVDGDDNLQLINEQNAGNPITRNLRPLLTIDVWEHAYYCDYQNRRSDAVEALWSVVDWSVIERRYLY